MIVNINTVRIRGEAPSVRIAGTVKDPMGNPLSRVVYLYDSARNLLENKTSDEDGNISFERSNANENNLWTVRGGGYIHENDDLSRPVRGVPV